MSAQPSAVHGGRRRSSPALALAWLLLLAGAAHAAWADTPRIVAMGDLHGDYDAFQALLLQAGLADDKGHWTGGKTVFIQLGDAVDRGARSRDIILELQQLQKEAGSAGGQVIALVGNHEAMNMEGDLRYVTPDDFHAYATRNSEALRAQTFEANKDKLATAWRKDNPQLTDAEIKARFEEKYPLGYFEQRIAWGPNGEIGRWVVGNPAIAIIGDSLFVHGGISAKYAAMTVQQVNDSVHAALSGTPGADKAILEDEAGPLWYRGLTQDNDSARADIAAAFKAYGIKRMIIAHTPSLSGIKVLQDGRVTMIDTGIMHAYGGKRSFLAIEGGTITAHDDGQATELKAVEDPPPPPPPPQPEQAPAPAPAAAASR